ncbi:MAG: ribonuclease P protein component 3 [Candidatus Aenigmatarchaeota archaeon]
MKFYDLHVQSNLSTGTSSIIELAMFAEQLGFSGIVICDKFESLEKIREMKEHIEKAKKEVDIEIYPGVEIEAKNPLELKQLLSRVREHVLVVAVHGGSYAINRAACEDSRVDVLCHPELGRIDSGLDAVCMKASAANDVAIQVNFRNILYSYRRSRSALLANMAMNVRLANELNAKTIICSAAQAKWDMRDPRELISIMNVLGTELSKAFYSLSDVPAGIIEKNTKKLMGKTVTEGVEVIG